MDYPIRLPIRRWCGVVGCEIMGVGRDSGARDGGQNIDN